MPVKIHGKNYVMVNERVKALHADHKGKCSIMTELVRFDERVCVIKATIDIDGKLFTGHAYENPNSSHINKTSYLENCETSAIGRALASAGYGVDESFASANEVQTAIHQQENPTKKELTRAQKFSMSFDEIAELHIDKKQFKNCKLAFLTEFFHRPDITSSKDLSDKDWSDLAKAVKEEKNLIVNFVKLFAKAGK